MSTAKFPVERTGTDYAIKHYLTINYEEHGITITLTREPLMGPAHPMGIVDLTDKAQLRLARICIDKGLPEDKQVLLIAAMTIMIRGMYFRSEGDKPLVAVFTATFIEGLCRFVSHDNSSKRLDYQALLAKSTLHDKKGSLRKTAELLSKLCDELVITDSAGLKYSGSFDYVPLVVKA